MYNNQQNQQNIVNLFFYSMKCPTCLNLIQILKNENILNYFKPICVDGNLDKIPKNITRVPTLIVSNIPKPLVAEEAFKWVQNIKFLRSQKLQEQNKFISNQKPNGPNPFLNNEMSGISDTFAYTNIDAPQPKSFFGYGDEDKHIIFTAPEQHKINMNEQRQKINEETKKRQNQEKEINKLMEETRNKIANNYYSKR
jgi:hypothetical protein